MGGRWGGDIKGRRREQSRRIKEPRRTWNGPRQPPTPRPGLAAPTLLAGVAMYLLVLAGALLTLG